MRAAPVVRISAGHGAQPRSCRLGVPLARGWLADGASLEAVDPVTGEGVALQTRTLASWPDRSVKWLLVDLTVAPGEDVRAVELRPAAPTPAGEGPMRTVRQADALLVDTGACLVAFDLRGDRLVASVRGADGAERLAEGGIRLRASGPDATAVAVSMHEARLEESGPVCTVVVQRGTIASTLPRPLEFTARWTMTAASSAATLELRVRNPNAAQHPGGLWDLGDPGSASIGDLSLEATPAGEPRGLAWRTVPDAPEVRREAAPWGLYQDSSGGERWDSPNHVEADGSSGVGFRGWRSSGAHGESRGDRAQPSLEIAAASGRIAASVQDFWQNFPKALRWRDGRLSVGLFPGERGRPTELQGGEQKRHRIAFAFGDDALDAAAATVDPPHAWVDSAWVEASGAVPGAIVPPGDDATWAEHVRTIVDGPDGFAQRRERIDEYGWRHFGDLWADHEAVNHTGSEPFVSHYNNQYDFVHSAGVHALRTGDARWARLARECADHTVDIDVYHTDADRGAFNGGLFWHTDHYLPARTATHRTYSRHNAAGSDYGGGPSNEHDYASGLLLHHFRTGDPDALEAVVGLADWVIAMDDGARTLLGVVDPGPTGLASRTLDPDYHGPGRGAGNSIATLLDAYEGTGRRHYMDKAEELVRRCIHPRDDIAARRLDDPEHRWSYLVFLQVLGGRYLPLKQALDERDYGFHYARASLLHYADWMLEHEVPYGDVLHKVELPTETWPAHDLRKCHVMHLAARYDDRGRRDAFRARAALFHDRCLQDIARFPTRHLTRPLVILAAYGHLHRYFERLEPFPQVEVERWRHAHDFGEPVQFIGQRERLKATLRARFAVVAAEMRRMLRDRLARRRPGRTAPARRPT